ncbi:MAG TPA: hypothetical protein PLX30_08935 [Methanothrix sp.]|nr:hypothetical protein [Methanothrix sp.]
MVGAGEGTIIKTGVALALLVLMSCSSWAADNSNGYYVKHEHRFEQTVETEGYCTLYQSVDTKTLQLQNYVHGSGIMDAATLISSNQTKTKYYPQDKNTLTYKDPVYGYQSNISFIEQNDMSYAPMAVAYGTGYYAKNPIVYNSKLKEKTEGKSYQEGVSMNHQIEYASAFQKDISVDLRCKDAINYTSPPVYGIGLARMEIQEVVTEGVVHVGELMADPAYGWKKPLIEIDENYIGNIRLTKKMEVSMTKSPEKPRTDWLSCCIGGYDEMEDDDKIWDEREIFDCTCRDVAWGDSWSDRSREQSIS